MARKRTRHEVARTNSPGTRRGRLLAYGALVGAVTLLAGWLAVRPLFRGGRGASEGTVLLVQADMGGFRPKVIRARAGEPITIRLESLDTRFHLDGGGQHQLAIDELGVNLIASPLGTSDTTFVVPEPGVYPFYCSICCGGKANPTMWGRLIVRA